MDYCGLICDVVNPYPESVCGSDGKTYPESCKIHVENCRNPGLNITEECKGECPCDKSTPPPSNKTIGNYYCYIKNIISKNVIIC